MIFIKKGVFAIPFLLFSASGALALPFTGGGGSVGNGGNGISAVLSSAIVRLDHVLAKHCHAKGSAMDAFHERACLAERPLFEMIMKTKISTRYIVYGKSDYLARDAVNDVLPDGNAFVTFSLKRLYEGTPEERRRVILHEFMTLIKFESSDSYGYSTLILEFLGDDSDLEKILSSLPPRVFKAETFRALDATVQNGKLQRPVLLQNAEDYRRFCVSKGFEKFTSVFIEDVEYAVWEKINQLNNGAVILDNDGLILQVVDKPDPRAHVIKTVTCE